ncbi:MAG TPA: ABC transporter substrate-binding protein [Hyphomicrobiaceae bacterium]|nr:ABC transporter substrate-binding protein [Hyphomicrobiaceae bacterium]
MRRREFLRAGAAGALAAPAVAAPAIAQTAPEIKWRLASSYPKSLEVMYGSAQILSRYVAEATDNRFLIQPYAAGELAQSQQALDAVASGAVECAYTPLYFYASKDPVLGLGSGLPFGLNARQQLSWLMFGGGRELIGEALRKFNAHGIPAGCTGAQMGAWFKKEITSLDDLKGLRFRVGGLGGPVLARLGVYPLKLGHADVYTALENGTIDAAEFLSPHDDEKLGLVRVAKHNHYPCWWESGGMVHLVVNLDRWNALPKSFQAIVARACDAVNGWMLARYDAINPPALKRLVAAGAIIKPFPPAVMEACYKATVEHHAELAAKDAGFRRALESANSFRKEQLAWWQIAEHAYDGIMLANRGRA